MSKFHIHKVTGRSVAEIQRCIHHKTALIEYVLFMGDHNEIAERLRNLLKTLSQAGEGFRIFELNDDEGVSGILDGANEIDANVLETILLSHEG